ncbi:MAG: pyridoxine 5'-phosphate synthase [Phycisphaerales bacterium]
MALHSTGPLLGVNIDHIASLRQARYRTADGSHAPMRHAEPDPARAAHEAELGGADIITVHLREDRRHINDDDLARIVSIARVRVNLEMGATEEMVGIALKSGVPMVTLVPEGRQEVTTEGGLNVVGQLARLKGMVAALNAAKGGMTVSAFIDPDIAQVQASKDAGFAACEFHTGAYAVSFALTGGDLRLGETQPELDKLTAAGHHARSIGMRFHAGHGLNYVNVPHIARLPGMSELHIGHSSVSRGAFTGLRQAVADMKQAIIRSLR